MRVRNIALSIAVTVVVLTSGNSRGQADDDWAAITAGDLAAIRTIIAENHPGPVDDRNPDFREWLDAGYRATLERARTIESRADFERTLRFYVNGFGDGHLTLGFHGTPPQAWPGFLTVTGDNGATTVTVSELENTPRIGDRLIGCDDRDVADLEHDTVHVYRTNRHIPHERQLMSAWLFVAPLDDIDNVVSRCSFAVGNEIRNVVLDWRSIEKPDLERNMQLARGIEVTSLGVHHRQSVWFVSIPSFNWWGDRAAMMQDFLEELRNQREALHAAKAVVIDVRNNTGGSSDWGSQIASVLWNQDAVKRITAGFDWSVDWRVSESNIAALAENAERSAKAGLAGDARYFRTLVSGMKVAARQGDELLHSAAPSSVEETDAKIDDPFSGRVYFLTDFLCASACLDFADIMLRLPNVKHIGLATSADTVYIDNTFVELPSGKAVLSYSLKVYRNRFRGNNQWYTPEHLWPGGPMSYAAIGQWIESMSSE